MEPSPELKDLTHRFIEAVAAGNTAFVNQAYSHQPGTLQIGTDPTEWWHGWDTITGVWRDQIAALGGTMPVAPGEIEAWQEGNVGWVAASMALQIPDETAIPMRLTAVFHREDGDWKVVQGHGSIGVRNEDTAFGEMPT
jgi:ketosteroid isomerase-like protein